MMNDKPKHFRIMDDGGKYYLCDENYQKVRELSYEELVKMIYGIIDEDNFTRAKEVLEKSYANI